LRGTEPNADDPCGPIDAVMAKAKAAGAAIVRPAKETFYGGYAGCFQDPDGHVWEAAWNPQWTQ
jgi:uncharacterized glyoxalase superfamily protein PhnB